jgi:flavin reductase (DIM6/NTAB) family NADH-FMN oxidoreductase RutF
MTVSTDWMAQFDGNALENKTGVSALLATSDADGWPHVAYLSCGEVLAVPPDRVRLCLWARSGTARNIMAAGRACLHVAADGVVWEERLSSIGEATAETLFMVEMEVVETIRHQAPYARVEAMIGFALSEPTQTLVRWRNQLARLRAFEA